MKNKNRQKYVNYFFAAFDFFIILQCIFHFFIPTLAWYRWMLGAFAFECVGTRLLKAMKYNE